MANENEERFKKLIEEKKKKGMSQAQASGRASQKIGENRKTFKAFKKGGLFDK
ncbi:MAG: hypothetical protein PF505_08130 [Vallitaleaceae bacterium]|jgi:predicted DNA-binding WGR domain protein|nr:hypothetical protein [Vallitaleaceae bacterium]